MDLYSYKRELNSRKFDNVHFQEFKSFVENNLTSLPYYLDYITELSIINEVLKNENSIKELKGFWCVPPSINGETNASYHKLNEMVDSLNLMKICIKPAKAVGGNIFLAIVNAEKFYDYICLKIEQLITRILK